MPQLLLPISASRINSIDLRRPIVRPCSSTLKRESRSVTPQQVNPILSHPPTMKSSSCLCFLLGLSFLVILVIAEPPSATASAFGDELPCANVSFSTSVNWDICVNTTIMYISPNSSRDDFGTFLSSELAKMSRSGGGSIMLRKGVFQVKSPIVLPDRTCLIGDGMDNTFVRVTDNSASHIPKGGVIQSVNSRHVSLRNFTVDCNGRNQQNSKAKNHFAKYGVFFEACRYSWFKNVRVKNALGYGFFPHGSDVRQGKHVIIEGAVADNCGVDGIRIARLTHAVVKDCNVLLSGRHGINFESGTNAICVDSVMVVDSGFASKRGSGLNMRKSVHVKVNNFREHDSYQFGFRMYKVKDFTLENSLSTGNRHRNAHCYMTEESNLGFIVNSQCAKPSRYAPGSFLPGIRCTGLEENGVCCPKWCDGCNSSACDAAGYKQKCCPEMIKESDISCERDEPPCLHNHGIDISREMP